MFNTELSNLNWKHELLNRIEVGSLKEKMVINHNVQLLSLLIDKVLVANRIIANSGGAHDTPNQPNTHNKKYNQPYHLKIAIYIQIQDVQIGQFQIFMSCHFLYK